MKHRTHSHEVRQQQQKSLEVSPLLTPSPTRSCRSVVTASAPPVISSCGSGESSSSDYGSPSMHGEITNTDCFDESEMPATSSIPLETIACYSIAAVLLLGGAVIIFVFVRNGGDGIQHILVTFMDWVTTAVTDSPVGMAILVIIPLIVVTTVLCMPYTIWAAAVGFLYSTLGGAWSIIVSCCIVGLGVWLGCVCSFLIGKQLLRKQTKQLVQRYPQIKSFDIVLERKPQMSIWLVTISKLAPVFPAFITNYGFAATSIDNTSFAIGTIFGALPMPFVWVYMGSSLSSLDKIFSVSFDGTQSIIIFGVGLLMLLGAVGFVARYSQSELQKILAEQGEKDNEDIGNVEVISKSEPKSSPFNEVDNVSTNVLHVI